MSLSCYFRFAKNIFFTENKGIAEQVFITQNSNNYFEGFLVFEMKQHSSISYNLTGQ